MPFSALVRKEKWFVPVRELFRESVLDAERRVLDDLSGIQL